MTLTDYFIVIETKGNKSSHTAPEGHRVSRCKYCVLRGTTRSRYIPIYLHISWRKRTNINWYHCLHSFQMHLATYGKLIKRGKMLYRSEAREMGVWEGKLSPHSGMCLKLLTSRRARIPAQSTLFKALAFLLQSLQTAWNLIWNSMHRERT